jgi:hypothetical protein
MTTDTVQQIEQAIATLSADELRELYSWLEQNRPHPFDLRIESDFAGGRLDNVLLEALEDEKNGRYRPL